MNKETIFAAWSPETSLWSRWTKPVLFAYMDSVHAPGEPSASSFDVNWCASPEQNVAMVVDLPGADGVWLGVALAERGYRPVPLYNALPLPSGEPLLDPFSGRRVAAVDVLPIISALRNAAARLIQFRISSDAPPAFLLDANRQGDGRTMMPEEFDNRSVCFTTDFPSANFLLANGIQRALVVQRLTTVPQTDLAYILRRWQEGGIILERLRVDLPTAPERFEVTRPSWFGAMFQRALLALGLRRASGGFGAWVPESSAGG